MTHEKAVVIAVTATLAVAGILGLRNHAETLLRDQEAHQAWLQSLPHVEGRLPYHLED